MTEFEEMLSRTLVWEGLGKLTDIPADKGGATRWGITYSLAMKYGYNVTTLTRDQAVDVYRQEFYNVLPVQGDFENLLPDIRVKWVLFDSAVMSGDWRAITFLQLALGVFPSGHTDQTTQDAAIEYTRSPDWAEGMLTALSTVRANRYRAIVANDASQAIFLRGWLNRAADRGEGLKELIGNV